MKTRNTTIWVVVIVLAVTGTSSAALVDGLLAYYPFNGNANDETGSGHDGTVYGATLTTDRFGNANSAYRFDGVDDYIDVANPTDFGFHNESFSVSSWVQVADNANIHRNMVCFTDLDGLPLFTVGKSRSGFQDGRLYAQIHEFGSSYPAAGQSIAFSNDDGDQLLKNEWLHVVSVVDCGTSELRLYVNDSLQQSYLDWQTDGLIDFDFSSAESLKAVIGLGRSLQDSHYGLIDDVRIYNRALSEAEVTQLYIIPEPATLLLLCLGAMMLRRKR